MKTGHPFLRTDIRVRVCPKRDHDRTVLLDTLARQDVPFIHLGGTFAILGPSELSLEITLDRLKRGAGNDLKVGAPEVCYLESASRGAEFAYRHKARTGNPPTDAQVGLKINPRELAGDCLVKTAAAGQIEPHILASAERGLASAMDEGPLARKPLANLEIVLLDIEYGPSSDLDLAVETTARMALLGAVKLAGPVLLEPMIDMRVIAPNDHVDAVVNDLRSRRGRIGAIDTRLNMSVIDAQAPLANLFGYINSLRSLTLGRGDFVMVYSHHAPVPPRPDGTFPMAAALRG